MFDVQSFIEHNQFLTGGALLGTAGIIWNYCRSLPNRIINFIRSRLTMSIMVNEKDVAYSWVNLYLNKNLKNKRHVHAKTSTSIKSNGEVETVIDLFPAKGNHFGWFHKHPMWIVKESPESTSDPEKMIANMMKGESYTISFLWFDLSLMPKFMNHCKELHMIKVVEEPKIIVRIGVYGNWRTLDKKDPRPIESIIMAENSHLDLIEDAKKFRSAKKRYSELGVPWHRGYLLSGPPGNGKSSLILAVASALSSDVNFLQLSTVRSDSDLAYLISDIHDNSILVIEDIDCAFVEREGTEKISLSGLLNALDGLCAKDGQIVFMTTNYPEKLDSALKRPGRVDYTLEVKNATLAQIETMALRFYPERGEIWAKIFSKQFKDREVSMAKVQEELMKEGSLLKNVEVSHKSLSLPNNRYGELSVTPVRG